MPPLIKWNWFDLRWFKTLESWYLRTKAVRSVLKDVCDYNTRICSGVVMLSIRSEQGKLGDFWRDDCWCLQLMLSEYNNHWQQVQADTLKSYWFTCRWAWLLRDITFRLHPQRTQVRSSFEMETVVVQRLRERARKCIRRRQCKSLRWVTSSTKTHEGRSIGKRLISCRSSEVYFDEDRCAYRRVALLVLITCAIQQLKQFKTNNIR